MNLYIFGASIPYGDGGADGGWAAGVQRAMLAGTPNDGVSDQLFYNLSVPGETTGDLLLRFYDECRVRLRMNKDRRPTFIFAIGGNDTRIDPKNGKYPVTLEKFQSNMGCMLRQSINNFNPERILVQNITPVLEAVTMGPERPMHKSNAAIERYNAALLATCREYSVELLDAHGLITDVGPERAIGTDGVHLTGDPGHTALRDMYLDVLGLTSSK